MNKTFDGIAASKGIVIAKAFKLEEKEFEIVENGVSVEVETELFENGIKNTVEQIANLKVMAEGKLSTEELAVFDAHASVVNDPELKTQATGMIAAGKSAAKAVEEVTNSFIMIFESMDDEYFRGRASDIKDVKKRLIANILNEPIADLTLIKDEVIIIANDLTPSETSQLNKNFTLGFVTQIGGRTSHAAIMARSMEIPAILGVGEVLSEINQGDVIILNAIDGVVTVNPTEEQVAAANAQAAEYANEQEMLKTLVNQKTVSKDNHHVELAANIGSYNDIEGVINNGAEGIGLYRTEFLYMDSNEMPSEEKQFEAYKKVLEAMGDKPVVVRTLDIGGDKELPYLDMPEEMNPFLGYRAIRLCLDQKDIFNTQLRALLRASVFGNLKVMFPMIATLNEFREAKQMLLDMKEQLISEGIAVSDNIEIGIMVEIPSTAVMADTFAKEVDFMSIGTNDLIQYTMACDRMSEKIAYLYQPYNPAILRLVKNVVDAANKNGIWAGMCGEMASDPLAQKYLLAIGLHEFSMSASAILPSRKLISELSREELATNVEEILDAATFDDVQEILEKI